MATLEKIRNRAGLLVGAVGLALFAFIIGDGLRSGSTFLQQSKETVISVNGESVKIDYYSTRLAELTDMYTMQTGANLTDEQQAQLRDDVFESIIREKLLEEAGNTIGFTVTSNELFDMVQGENISPMIQQMPMFRNESGMFDREALMQYLRTIQDKDNPAYSEQDRAQIEGARKYWLFVEQALVSQKMEEKFGTLLSKAIVVNKLDAQANYNETQGSVDFDYVVKPYSSVADSLITVSNSEIESLYKKRKELFKQEPAVNIKYIAVTVAPSQEDFIKVENEIEALKKEMETSEHFLDIVNENSDTPYYDAYKASTALSSEATAFAQSAQVGDIQGPILLNSTYQVYKFLGKTTAPDSIRLNQMTMPPLTEAELNNLTDSLAGVIKNGKSFSDLAIELTGGQSNGDAGWMTDEVLLRSFDDKFRNAVSTATLNQVMVIKSTRGTHLVQVVDKTKPVEKYKVAQLIMSVEPSNKTLTEAYTKINQYVLKNNKLDSFEAAAPEAGYMCLTNTLTPNQQSVAGIPSTRQIVRWAFEHKRGDVSEVYECEGYKYVVAVVENNLKKGYQPVKAVNELLKRELINDKKADILITQLKELNCDSLAQCADQLNTTVQSVSYVNFATPRIAGLGAEPALNFQAPLAEVNKVSGPVKGNQGVFLFVVKQKHDNTQEFNVEQQKQALNMQNSYFYSYQAMQSLRQSANVEDSRIRFY